MKETNHLLTRDNTLWTQGISAIMIMLMHFIMQIDGYPRALNILGSIGVAAFLFISGFGINESYKNTSLKGYWHKRIVRVIIPYWMVILFKLPFNESFNMPELLNNLFFIDSELWFIDFIIRLYIIYWCARKFFTRYTTHILIIFSIAFIFTQQLTSEQAFSFLSGYIVSHHYESIRKADKKVIIRFTLLAFLYGCSFTLIKEMGFIRKYIGTLPFNIILLNIKLPLAISIITAPYLLPILKKTKVIQWFGKISYELYIVHYSFMPFITSIVSIIKWSTVAVAISTVFNKINIMLRKHFTITFTAIIYISVCYLMICKYSMRLTDSFGYVCLPYIMVLGVAILLLQRKQYLQTHYQKTIFWVVITLFVVSLFAVQYHFDPMTNRVDRWSAIAYPIDYLFKGEFPYMAKTHLDGNASPFPVWMILHIPFWLLGNVGLSEIFTAFLFLYSVRLVNGYNSGIKATVLLGLCINMWYETSVRSDLISNFLLLGAFINCLLYKKITFKTHPFLLSAIAGLWLSTRISTAFPLFIMFFPYWLQIDIKKKIISILLVLFVFGLTFLPLIIWDYQYLFGAENNPFSLQSRQGHTSDSIIFVIVAILMAIKWNGNINRLMFFSAIILCLVPMIAYGHSMYIYNNWTDIFNSIYDITYLDAALPFCITLLSSAITTIPADE